MYYKKQKFYVKNFQFLKAIFDYQLYRNGLGNWNPKTITI